MFYGLEYACRTGLGGEVNVLEVHQPGEFLMVTVGHDHRHGIASHHVFIGAGAARDQDVLQRYIPLVGTPAQGEALGCPHWHDIQKLAK